jgi:putative phosphoesterase
MLANMILGVISDTHGRVDNILTALAHFRERRVELIIHCGDIDNEDSVAAFTGWPVHFVFGNCDWNREAIRSAIAAIGGTLHEPYGHLEFDDKDIAWIHGDQAHAFRDLESADCFDYLFYGHTHVAEQHRVGRTLVVNPGALQRARTKTCLVLDTTSGELTTIVI